MKERTTGAEGHPDIFDRLMGLPVLRIFEPFYRAHKEGLLYLFFGGVTTLVGLGSFWLLESLFGLDALLANPISWVLAVLVAFLTNRVWVFGAPTRGVAATLRQLASFSASRVATLLIEEAILFVFVTWLGLHAFAVKLAASVIVVVLNYVLSKIFVFRKTNRKDESDAA